jgi:hypothetical protein
MKTWLSEIIDQIALGEFLAYSKVSCGQRFGLIAVDNAVEFMLIAYVEVYKQLVGGHKLGGIIKKDWEDTKKHFPKLLAYVATLEPNLQTHVPDITRYHEFRNSLYHSGTPVTTTSTRVAKYSKLAQEILAILFTIKLTPQEWDSILSLVESSLSSQSPSHLIKRQVTYDKVDDFVKFTTSASPTASEAVAICLHGCSILTGAPPSRPSLLQSLARSGHALPLKVLNARLFDLRRNGWLQKNALALSAKARKELAKKYLL